MQQRQRNQAPCGDPWRLLLPQQYNCKGYRLYQQQSAEKPLPKHMVSPSTDSESKQFRFQKPYRKFMHKQKHIVKLHERPLHKPEEKLPPFRSLKRDVTAERDQKPKHQWFQVVFDWMMEAASLLKVSKNACYRSIIIFFRVCQLEPSIIGSKLLSNYVCGALSLGSKFQSNVGNYLESVFLMNARRVSKEQIWMAECFILKILKWRIPVDISIELELSEIVNSWNEYLSRVSREFPDRGLIQKMSIGSSEKASNKFYIQVVYIIDYLVVKLYNEFLRQSSFRVVILMTIYMLASINLGDVHLNQNSAWPTFEKFLVLHNMLGEKERLRLKMEVHKYFNELRIIEVLGGIPLNPSFDKFIRRRNEQFYIPKIETIF